MAYRDVKTQANSTVPPPPRRPKTAYFLFTANERPAAKQEYPNYGFGELGKVLGDKWAKLPEAEKSVCFFFFYYYYFLFLIS